MTDPIRYKLDDLGWYQFEALVQSLFKVHAGLAVESWGGSSDLGRDAYSEQDVRLSSTLVLPGPVIFQAKFIRGANAAGARLSGLKSAVQAELTSRHHLKAAPPGSYVLITNAPLGAAMRTELQELLQKSFRDTAVKLFGSRDVCDLLDQHPELRRAFPELLSLRDLDTLIAEVVNRDVLERSRAAVEEARDLVPVFVPTAAYVQALTILEKYGFVVLDGAPEMGKTAIARTIGLTHLFSGWQVIDCRESAEFFRLYCAADRQIFIADDAFGRTEYDPARGRDWERSLPKVLRILNSEHRFILTTRKHVLQRGLREMDLADKAERFPSPAELVVSATELTIEERARMLYRHAKSAKVAGTARDVIRKQGLKIVTDLNFTPERIRLAMSELSTSEVQHSAAILEAQIFETIRNPTQRVRVTFQKLRPAHQWVLIAFLECDRWGFVADLETRFRALSKEPLTEPFVELLEDIVGTFLTQIVPESSGKEKAKVSWIHPSYRDLVISELRNNEQHRWHFFSCMTEVGTSMSLTADAGGDKRVLTSTADDVERVLDRAIALVEQDADLAAGLCEALRSCFAADPSVRDAIKNAATKIVTACLAAISRRDWTPSASEISQVWRSLVAVGVTPPPLDFTEYWNSVCGVLESSDEYSLPGSEELEQWIDLRALLTQYYADIFAQPGYGDRDQALIELIVKLAQGEIEPPWYWSGDPSEEKAAQLYALADALDSLDIGMKDLANRLRTMSDMYSPQPSYAAAPDASVTRPQSVAFDVLRLLEDL